MSDGIRAMWMRGGTSKGGYFLKDDLPSDAAERDTLLLRIMGSPDPRQIDGMGGADPLTSKVAIVSPSDRPGVDVEYRFLQVSGDQAIVSDAQNCGNLLAGVAPFAIERDLVDAQDGETAVTIYMVNSDKTAVARVQSSDGSPIYSGTTSIDGVPGQSAPIELEFEDIAGSTCGALLPTGQTLDVIDGIPVTLIDNGMPCVLIKAADVCACGYEDREALDRAEHVKAKVEAIRLKAGPMMSLGDVANKTVPKMILLAPPRHGGVITTRSFIPHRAHASIGVFAAVSVATACTIDSSVAAPLADMTGSHGHSLSIEHPTGAMSCLVARDDSGQLIRAGLVRTARKLMDGKVFP
ncbi:MAG: 4-oxalomesaconate tautomerase [Pseudomonadota bacterium]